MNEGVKNTYNHWGISTKQFSTHAHMDKNNIYFSAYKSKWKISLCFYVWFLRCFFQPFLTKSPHSSKTR